MNYVNLLSLVNKSSLTKVIKLSLLRLLLGEKGQSPFDAGRLNEVSSLDNALRQRSSIWGADDNTFTAHIYSLYDNEEYLLYR